MSGAARSGSASVREEIGAEEHRITQVHVPDLTAGAPRLTMHHHADAPRQCPRDGEFLRADERDVGPPVQTRGMRRELADEIRGRGEDRRDDVVRREIVIVEDGFEQLGDGLADQGGIVVEHGGGAADRADAARTIRPRAHSLEDATPLAPCPPPAGAESGGGQ